MDSQIIRKNLPVNESTHVCSEHFVNSRDIKLRSDEVQTLNLPTLPPQVTPTSSCRPLIRHALSEGTSKSTELKSGVHYADAAVNTNLTCVDIETLEGELSKVKILLLMMPILVQRLVLCIDFNPSTFIL